MQKYLIENEKSKEELIKSVEPMIRSIAYKYRNSGVDLEDLIQEGTLSVIKAIDKYDPSKSKFSTFVYRIITNDIIDYVKRNNRIIRVPFGLFTKINTYEVQKQKLLITYGNLSLSEIAALLNKPLEKIEEYEKALTKVESLNTRIVAEEETELINLQKDETIDIEDIVMRIELKRKIQQLLTKANLTEEEMFVIIHRMGFKTEPKTYKAIGEIMGTYRGKISKMEKEALQKMRKENSTSNLKVYLRK